MPRQRDHKAEYQRRVARGASRGLTKAQSRGHPSLGQPLASNVGKLPEATSEINDAVKRMRKGASLRDAAHTAETSEYRLRRFLRLHNMARREGRNWRIQDGRLREVAVVSGGRQSIIKTDVAGAQAAGTAWDLQARALKDHDIDLLATLDGQGVVDHRGTLHPFETDPNALLRVKHAEDDEFHEIYRIL